jgi:hypothetical protein
VFQDRERTAQWLDVPIEPLAAEPSGEKHSERVNSIITAKKARRNIFFLEESDAHPNRKTIYLF